MTLYARFNQNGSFNSVADNPPLEEDHCYEVVTTPQPADTSTQTYEPTYTIQDETAVQVWVARNWTAAELAVRNAEQNEAALRGGVANIVTRAQERQVAMQGLIDQTNATLNGQPSTYLRILARADKRRDSDIIRLARLIGGLTDSASVGDET